MIHSIFGFGHNPNDPHILPSMAFLFPQCSFAYTSYKLYNKLDFGYYSHCIVYIKEFPCNLAFDSIALSDKRTCSTVYLAFDSIALSDKWTCSTKPQQLEQYESPCSSQLFLAITDYYWLLLTITDYFWLFMTIPDY